MLGLSGKATTAISPCWGGRHRLQPQPAPLSRSRTQWRSTHRVYARSGRQRTRLATRITTIPRRLDLYFADNLGRRTLWSTISFGAGYYAANTVSLSFGALAINDVVAAALTVGFCEVTSALYYGSPNPDAKLIFLNSFKVGIIAAFMADAFKLGG